MNKNSVEILLCQMSEASQPEGLLKNLSGKYSCVWEFIRRLWSDSQDVARVPSQRTWNGTGRVDKWIQVSPGPPSFHPRKPGFMPWSSRQRGWLQSGRVWGQRWPEELSSHSSSPFRSTKSLRILRASQRGIKGFHDNFTQLSRI